MQPYHIIIAEDDYSERRILHFIIRNVYPDAQVTLAEDGSEALLAFQQKGADLVTTDSNMPRMSGIQLVRALRAQHATVPIMMLANMSSEEEARKAGANYFAYKPFDFEELEKVLHQLLPPREA